MALNTRTLTDLLRLVFPALAALIAILSASYLTFLDHQLFNFIGFKAQNNIDPACWRLIPMVVLSAVLASEAALRVNSKFLPIVFIQTTAVAAFLAWLTWQWGGRFSLLCACIAATLSFALGLAARSFKRAEEKQTSRYFELALKNDELNQTRLSLLKQDEADRRILASDLHDQVLNEIKAIKSQLPRLTLGDCTDSKEQLLVLEKSLDTTVSHIREVMESLFPSVLENLGLCAALDQLTRDTAHNAGLQGRFIKSVDGSMLDLLNKTEQLLLFRLSQEALNNIVKHAQAKTVKITLETIDDHIRLSIIDNGIGFQAKERGDSRGLRYMRLRADLIGAHISWKDHAPKGTIVTIDLPETKKDQHAI